MNETKTEKNGLGSLLHSEEILAVEICENEMDFSKLCRTCLRETNDNDMTNDTLCIISSNGKLVRLYEMFEAVTGLKIESDDMLPHHLCSPCLKLVNSSYTFRSQGQRADEILRNILSKVKDEADQIEENHEEEDFAEEPEEPEELEVIESIKESEVVEQVPLVDEVENDFQDTIEDEVMEIEQLEEFSEPEGKYEVLDMEVPANCFTCPFCMRVFFLQRDIIQHYKDEHPREKPFKCLECLASFAHIQSLRRHSKTHIASAKEKMCSLCSRMFHRADDLKRHIRTHTDERPYPCPMCQKAFKQHTELKDHMLSHTDSKMYKCTLCTKEWRSRNGWYLHMKLHQEGKTGHRRKTKRKNTLVPVAAPDTATVKAG